MFWEYLRMFVGVFTEPKIYILKIHKTVNANFYNFLQSKNLHFESDQIFCNPEKSLSLYTLLGEEGAITLMGIYLYKTNTS